MEWARGERTRLIPLRDLGSALIERPAWVLFQGRSLETGQRGVAGLVDVVLRFAPEALDPLLEALSCWRLARDLDAVAHLKKSLDPVWSGWARYVARDKDVPNKLVAPLLYKAGEVLPFAVADGQARDEAEAILAYRAGTTDLNRHRLGAWWAATWAADERLARLVALRPALDAQRLFLDLVVIAVVGAHRMLRVMAQRGEVRSPPDLSAMNTPATKDVSRPNGLDTLIRPTERVATTATKVEVDMTYGEAASWWVDATAWARGDTRLVLRLLDLADHYEKRPMWPLVRFELNLLEPVRSLRQTEWSRLALATLLLEFHRCEPEKYGELLQLLTTEQVTLATCGHIWQCFDPVFSNWAKSLAGDGIERHHEARRLSEIGDIVPWLELKGTEAERERHQLESVHGTYGKRTGQSAENARVGAYFAATFARNDVAHKRTQRLEQVVLPIELFRDILVFGSLAALRFRRKLNETGPLRDGPPSMADIDCVRTGPFRLKPGG